jgi:hypothetical protein
LYSIACIDGQQASLCESHPMIASDIYEESRAA